MRSPGRRWATSSPSRRAPTPAWPRSRPRTARPTWRRDGPGTVTFNGNQLNRRAFNGQFGPTGVTIRGLIITNYWNGFQIGGSGPRSARSESVSLSPESQPAQNAIIHGGSERGQRRSSELGRSRTARSSPTTASGSGPGTACGSPAASSPTTHTWASPGRART